MKEKICVYTCMTGNYDSIKEIPHLEDGIDYYCFTNNKNIKSDTWKVIYIEDDNLTNLELARRTKILGTPMINEGYDILLWMDAAVTFKKPIKDFIKKYLTKTTSFVAFKHGERDNIKEEMEACYRFNKEDKTNIDKLIKFYKKENYNYDNGLIESTVYIKRPKDEIVKKTMELWFDMIKNYSRRDQLSFNYCIEKTNLKVKWINEKVFNNDWFLWENHNLNRNITKYSVYYGNINNYKMANDYHYDYKKDNNKYIIRFTTKQDTSELYINLNCLPTTWIKDIKVKGITKYNLLNSTKLNDKTIFYNTFPFIHIKSNIKKNTSIIIELILEEITEQEKIELISKLSDEIILLKDELHHERLNNIEKDATIADLSTRLYNKWYNKLYAKLKRK